MRLVTYAELCGSLPLEQQGPYTDLLFNPDNYPAAKELITNTSLQISKLPNLHNHPQQIEIIDQSMQLLDTLPAKERSFAKYDLLTRLGYAYEHYAMYSFNGYRGNDDEKKYYYLQAIENYLKADTTLGVITQCGLRIATCLKALGEDELAMKLASKITDDMEGDRDEMSKYPPIKEGL